MANVLPWSWSSYNDYQTCPKRFYETRIAKSVSEPDSEHLLWGKQVHKALELRMTIAAPLPPRMQAYEKIAATLSEAPGIKYAECKTAVTSEFVPCTFFDPLAWNRGVDDLVIINGSKALDIDYKTGKETKLSLQLAISAARLFALHPQLTEITTAYAWLATGKFTKARFLRSDITGIWEETTEVVQQMMWSERHNTWPAKPSGLCKRSKRPGSTYAGCPVTNCPHSENYRKP